MKQVVKKKWWDFVLFEKDLLIALGWFLPLLSDRIIFLLLLLYFNEMKVNKSRVKTKQKLVYKCKVHPYLVKQNPWNIVDG